jgi:DNA-binding NtrC family response regulator
MKSYKMIWVEGKCIRLHRYIMEKSIGRKLTFNEIVHHKNGDIHDNDLLNLEIISRSDHMRIHKIKEYDNPKYDLSKELLNDLYYNKKLTTKQISKIVGCCWTRIYQKMKEYNIKPNWKRS